MKAIQLRNICFLHLSQQPVIFQGLASLPAELVYHILDFTHFDSLAALSTTCRRLRILTLAWAMRYYRAKGVCSFGKDIHLSADSDPTSEEALATITTLTILIPREMARRTDFRVHQRFLQTTATMPPNLSFFECKLEKTGEESNHGYCWEYCNLVRRLTSLKLGKGPSVILYSGHRPKVLGSRPVDLWRKERTSTVRCFANVPHAFDACVRAGMALQDTASRWKKVIIRQTQHKTHNTWANRAKIYDIIYSKASMLTAWRIVSPAKEFSIVLLGRETMSTLHIRSDDISYLDWSLLLPIFDLPSLSNLYFHCQLRGLTPTIIHSFLKRHPSITAVVIYSEDGSLMNAEAFKDCLPSLDTLEGPVHIVVEILRVVPQPRKLKKVKIMHYHTETLGIHPHPQFNFDLLDTVMDLVAFSKVKYLGIGLPGGSAAEDWLTKPSHAFSGDGKFGWMSLLHFWPYDCRPFGKRYPHWFHEFRVRNFPSLDRVTVSQPTKSYGSVQHPAVVAGSGQLQNVHNRGVHDSLGPFVLLS